MPNYSCLGQKWLLERTCDLLKKICFFASKGVGLSLDIWPSRKGLLQNIYLILDLLYHKCNSLIMTVVDDITSLKIF